MADSKEDGEETKNGPRMVRFSQFSQGLSAPKRKALINKALTVALEA